MAVLGRNKTYDHRLRELVRKTGDLSIATDLGVPRSTAAGWLRSDHRNVVTVDVLDMRELDVQAEVLRLRRRLRVVGTIVGLFVILVRVSGCSLDKRSHVDVATRAVIVKAIERARRVLSLRTVLRILRLSSSRFHAWKNSQNNCRPPDRASCPRRAPNQLTPDEVFTIHGMVTTPEYRHVPTHRLAVLAQRLGKVFASPSTWARLVRQRSWRRPRSTTETDWCRLNGRWGAWGLSHRRPASRAVVRAAPEAGVLVASPRVEGAAGLVSRLRRVRGVGRPEARKISSPSMHRPHPGTPSSSDEKSTDVHPRPMEAIG